MDLFVVYIFAIIAVAYSFDFVNGFHDAANSVATVISTKVLPPVAAVGMAAFFNFVAFAIFGVAVATTVGKGIISPSVVTPELVLAALAGAIAWDLVTWYLGLPSSSSHALIGGLVGAAVTRAGVGSLVWSGLDKTLLFMVLSPVIGFVLAFVLMASLIRAFFTVSIHVVNRYFRRLQLVSSALVSLSHGTNDAQKTMGVITALLFSVGWIPSFNVPFIVAVLAATSIALGTFFGGWRIVKTLGFRMTKLDPVHGVSIETASAITIIASSLMGIPVSTTHVVSGSVMGSGATMGSGSVRWGVARRIIWAWLVTIPATAIIAAAAYAIMTLV
ncbi:MAG TPA: inorganic phosphate transporter [Nitrososphaerales archaeon]|nr:inorganic phosphate transporter [Nitrososphaerales archaeon]